MTKRNPRCDTLFTLALLLFAACLSASAGDAAQTLEANTPVRLAPPATHAPEAVAPRAAGREQAALEMFNLYPAMFTANKGQWDARIHYAFRGSGIDVLFTDEGPILELFGRLPPGDQAAEGADLQRHVVRVRFPGANPALPEGLDPSGSHVNYQVGDDPSRWVSAAPSFHKVCYRNIYDGVDLHIWGRRSGLKYEFHVAPGADWRQIAVKHEGIDGMRIDESGALRVVTSLGEIVDDAPVAFQDTPVGRTTISSCFRMLSDSSYGFELEGGYDATLPLVLDPDLAWSTYLGGSGRDVAVSVATDEFGYVYVTGGTHSNGWVSGAFDTIHNGDSDGFVAKLSASGQHIWSTYFGGQNRDGGQCIVVDSSGSIYVCGSTSSYGWVRGGYNTILQARDAFVLKLNASGRHLWSTYIGGSAYECAYGIATDSRGDVYITGETRSDGWVSGGLSSTYSGGESDVFVVKLSPAGKHLWSTFLGGGDADVGRGIATDASGDVYLAGDTASGGWVSGGFDATHNGGERDAFLVKLAASGQHLWSTYLGGAGRDIAWGVAANVADRVCVHGSTASSGWVSGGFDTSLDGERDAFVAMLDASGQHLWSTYLGGGGRDDGYGIAMDSLGNVYATGVTASSGWVSGGFDTSYESAFSEAFVVKLSASGRHLWSTYVGSDSAAYGIAVDSLGNLYVAGATTLDGWASGGFDTIHDGGLDAFVARIFQGGSELSWSVSHAVGSLRVQAGSEIRVNNTTWDLSENVIIASLLRADGTVRINTGTATIVGSGRLYLSDVHGVIGDVSLYSGPWTINGTQPVATALDTALSLLEINGVRVWITSLEIVGDAVGVKGRLKIDCPWEGGGSIAADLTAPGDYIAISMASGITMVGVASIPRLRLSGGGGWTVESGYLAYEAHTREFYGRLNLSFPSPMNLTIPADFVLAHGRLSGLGGALDDWAAPVWPEPPVSLQTICGRFILEPRLSFTTRRLDAHQNEYDTPASLTLGPWTQRGGAGFFPVTGTLGITVDPKGRFEATGPVRIIADDFEMPAATLLLRKDRGAWAGGTLGYSAQGIAIDMLAEVEMPSGDAMTTAGYGALSIGAPWIGFLRKDFGFGQLHAENASLVAWAEEAAGYRVGVQYEAGTGWSAVADYDARPVVAASGGAMQTTLADGIEAAIFCLSWAAGDADFQLLSPDGVLYAPETLDLQVTYEKDPSTREAFYVVRYPAPGVWRITVPDAAAIGEYRVDVYVQWPLPWVEVLTPALDIVSNGRLDVSWQAYCPAGPAAISLQYVDSDTGILCGVIADGLAAGLGGTYRWATADVPSGTYHVRARIADSRGIPVFSSSAFTVTVSNAAAPAAPRGVFAIASDSAVAISWNDNSEKDLLGYRVYCTADASAPGHQVLFDAGDGTELVIEGLPNGTMHRLWVTAFDTDLNESLPSTAVYARPAGAGNNSPAITSRHQRFCRVGTQYRYAASAEDIDGDPVSFELAEGPPSAVMTPEGLLQWTPALDEIGNRQIAIRALDGRGGSASRTFTVTVASPRDGNLRPSFVARPTPEATIGDVYTSTLVAVDPDGDPVSYRMIAGPEGLEFDAERAEIFWIPRGRQEGVQYATFEASDDRGGTVRQRFAIRARPDSIEAVSAFAVRRLQIRRDQRRLNADRVLLRATFNDSSAPIDWAATELEVHIGPYSGTIPAGALAPAGQGYRFTAAGRDLSGIVRAQVNSKTRSIDVSAVNVDLCEIGPNVLVRVKAGAFEGSCYVSVAPRNSYAYGTASGLLLTNVFSVDRAQFVRNTRLAGADRFQIGGSIFSAARLDLVSEPVQIKVGDLTWRIPPGALTANRAGSVYTHRGGGETGLASVQLNLAKGTWKITGGPVNLSTMGESVEVSIIGGTFSGTTVISLTQAGSAWRY